MFTQPVSMKCTQEQYEKDLKIPLSEMGYNEIDLTEWNIYPYLVTNYTEFKNRISNMDDVACERNGRYFIDHYNPELFLALAAMTEIKEVEGGEFGGKGEWIIHGDKFEKLDKKRFFNDAWRKATKEELINKFAKKEEMEKEQDLRELLQSGNIVEFRNSGIGIIIDTHMGRLIQWDNVWHSVSGYNEKLNTTCKEIPELDIMRVRKIQIGRQILPVYWKEAPVIWERIEPKEITLQELIEKAGYKAGEITVKVEQ